MKQTLTILSILIVFIATVTVPARAGTPLTDAQAIVEKANHVALYQGEGMKGRVHFRITDKQGRVRERTLNILRRDAHAPGKPGDGDQKYFTYFKSPADVRKMVFMVHKHAGPGKDDDRWLYMPAMDLVRRIAAGDKRTSFVGSDFLYEDISGRALYADTHKLVSTTDRHYVLENRPKDPDSVAFQYYLAWVDHTTFITDRVAFYKTGDFLYREMAVLAVENIPADEDGKAVVYPTVVRSVARNLETGSTTEMTLSNIVYNPGLGDALFSERYLRRPPRDITR